MHPPPSTRRARPIKKRSIEPLERLMEAIKVIEAAVSARAAAIAETSAFVMRDDVTDILDLYLRESALLASLHGICTQS